MKPSWINLVILGGCILLTIGPVFFYQSATAQTDSTTRVSIASDGTEGNERSLSPSISADGRYVAFESEASNLVSGDTNYSCDNNNDDVYNENCADIFVHDRITGQTERVSVASDGIEANSWSSWAVISANGRYVTFASNANNLVSDDTHGLTNFDGLDVFVHDRLTKQTERVSVASDGTQSNGRSGWPSISADGRYVAFDSRASNLISNDTNNNYDVFIRDRQTGQTEGVSVSSSGILGTGHLPSVSADGRYVAFSSGGTNLVSDDTNSEWDIFVHDRLTGQTERVSIASDGTQANGYPSWASISADGRYIAFESEATNLVSDDTNNYCDQYGYPTGDINCQDVFVHDRQTHQTARVSVASDGMEENGESGFPSISADGHYVTFYCWTSNLVSGDTNDQPDICLHDLHTNQTSLISISFDGQQGNWASWHPAISADGRFVVFDSVATNLVSDDTNGTYDVFVRDREGVVTYSISGRVTDNAGNPVSGVTISAGSNSTTTDKYGAYILSGLADGTYSLEPFHNSYQFTPTSRDVTLGPNAVEQDFAAVNCLASSSAFNIQDISQCVTPPLLDLPIAYPEGQFHTTLLGNEDGSGPGRVNSWFDHSYPTYELLPNSNNNNLTKWDGTLYAPASRIGVSSYDGHDGIDFSPNQSNEPIYAAAPGTVVSATFTCQVGDSKCGNLLGNQVWIDHGNGYATVYGHLTQALVGPGWVVTESNIRSQPIGIMGKTGHVIGVDGTHLHFGLYYDPNEQWGFRYTLDPYGWWNTTTDPWSNRAGMRSSYIWKYPGMSSLTLDSTGGTITSLSNRVSATVPNGAVSSPISLQLLETSPAADPSSQLHSAGTSFWLRFDENLVGDNNTFVQYAASVNFVQPITLQLSYSLTGTKHLDKNSLSVYRFDESSTSWIALAGAVNTNQQRVTAQTTQVGRFDLQGALLCPADNYEPNDNYHSAELISTNTITITSLFDIKKDEDWFWIDAKNGKKYQVETVNLASGVDTIVELYDFGGDVLLDSDDNSGYGLASFLEWTALANATYFIRVSQAPGSAFGCNAGYELLAKVEGVESVYLPIIFK